MLLTPPSLLAKIPSTHITSEKALPEYEYLKFPCHIQAVERCVKLVTKATGKVCGHENRDGYIRTIFKSRSLMPKFDTKSEFKFI